MSRTFIPAALVDNPYSWVRTTRRNWTAFLSPAIRGARRQLHGRPSGCRVSGDPECLGARGRSAVAEDGGRDTMMTAIGFDPAGGGADSAELRHDMVRGSLPSSQPRASRLPMARLQRNDRPAPAQQLRGRRGHGWGLRRRGAMRPARQRSVPTIAFQRCGSIFAGRPTTATRVREPRAEAWWRFRELWTQTRMVAPDRACRPTLDCGPISALRHGSSRPRHPA